MNNKQSMHTGGDVSTVVNIQPQDAPMTMAAIQPLLSDPEKRLGNQLTIHYPFTPPSGDPSQITKNDYRDLIMNSGACMDQCLNNWGGFGQSSKDAWAAVPILIAAWKGEPVGMRKQHYLDKAVQAVINTSVGAKQEFGPLTNPAINYYWWGQYWAYTHFAIQHTIKTPEYHTMMSTLWQSLAQIADGWPMMNFHGVLVDGAEMGPIAGAFWYDGALRYQATYGYQLANADKFKRFANNIWSECQTYNDIEDDDPWYGAADLFIIEAWRQLRGEGLGQELYRYYADHIANDGTYPAYGDGGVPGLYFVALLCAEMAATRTKDGQLKSYYKQLAHRAFWNGRGRLLDLRGSDYMNEVFTAMAYLHADDAIAEDPVPIGATLSLRPWRELTPVEMRQGAGRWFTFQLRQAPSKLVFRAGSSPTDACMVMQIGQLGGHGHMDAGAITYYGSDHAYYLDYATLRLDHYQEAHNIFTLRDNTKPDELWCGRLADPVDDPCLTTEEVLVPAMGTTSEASYARILNCTLD